MKLIPGAIARPISRNYTPRKRSRTDAVILHVAVSRARSLHGWFNNPAAKASSHLYVRKDGTCLAPEHRVLTSDMRWIPGGEVRLGDELIGFDEEASGKRRSYRRATVEWIERDQAETFAVVLDNEEVIYTTADHRWLTRSPSERLTWRRTIEPNGRTLVGARIPRLIRPWGVQESFDVGYLGGLLDGEGHLSRSHALGFTQRPTMVLDKALEVLDDLDVRYSVRKHSGSGDVQLVTILGRVTDRLELLGKTRALRLIDKINPDRLGAVQSTIEDVREVVAVYPVGVREIVKMQTSARTFIAEGFGMHNCEQYVSHEHSAWTSGAGSYRSIGIETEGMGIEPWTAAQCETLARVLAWAHKTYGVPLTLMDSSAPRARGVGWHRLGVPMTRAQLNRGVSYTGGELWSRSVSKQCPGAACIAQIPAIVSRARILAGLDKPAPKPTPAEALADAGILIGDTMKNVGIYTNRNDGTRVYAILNPASGFFHKFAGGTGKALSGTYVNPLAAAFDTGSWPFVTVSHMDVIEAACAAVRTGSEG